MRILRVRRFDGREEAQPADPIVHAHERRRGAQGQQRLALRAARIALGVQPRGNAPGPAVLVGHPASAMVGKVPDRGGEEGGEAPVGHQQVGREVVEERIDGERPRRGGHHRAPIVRVQRPHLAGDGTGGSGWFGGALGHAR